MYVVGKNTIDVQSLGLYDTILGVVGCDKIAQYKIDDFKYVGCGCTRVVVKIGKDICIKIAKNHNGVQQNKNEVQNFKILGSDYMASVYDYDDTNFIWVICEFLPNQCKDIRDFLGVGFWGYIFLLITNFCLGDYLKSSSYATNYHNKLKLVDAGSIILNKSRVKKLKHIIWEDVQAAKANKLSD